MSFIRTSLSQDEIEMFKELNISYGKKIVSIDEGVVGTIYGYVSEGVIGIVDREKRMYLFYCGDDSSFAREELWSPEYFILVSYEKDESIIIRMEFERKRLRNSYSRVLWKTLNIHGEKLSTHEKVDDLEKYYPYIEEAITVHEFRNEDSSNRKYRIRIEFSDN